ncbi:MAG: DEAD/DEAH box helicase [Oscillospiraceae bacterium]|nr:DEAD/DEAH box helicase [Oscillospiraceae bacterium]
MSINPLNLFHKYTRQWFEAALGAPTPVQAGAWPVIAAGGHTLLSAPTGTGKTLSAFLVFIDEMKTLQRAGKLENGLRLIYISPLKALAGDIRENLHKPLGGILREEIKDGIPPETAGNGISVAIRTGDTTSRERREMIKSPPHILITTPESLYLLLTSVSGQKMLKTAKAVILDELHALIDTKRGAHLMLSLARLDRLCGKPLQRVGLSATIEPLDEVAEYLSYPSKNVNIIAPKMKKDARIEVTSPAGNASFLPEGTIWPEIARSVYECCDGERSVIAFVGGRMHAEKLAFCVNRIAGEGFAKTHHGCVSKEQRHEAETALRSGELRLLCATSSMELGIDVGDIDRVVQIGAPDSISSLMQRLGRAGHNPGRVSVMNIFPRTDAEGLYCGFSAYTACTGGVERMHSPRLCFDVLAQHLVSMATGEGYTVDGVMGVINAAYPFKDVKKDDVKSILGMLAGDYEHKQDWPVRPRILYDRINERVEGDAYSRMLAVSAGGTIPDTGMFAVRAESGAKLGELDEEFVFEARVGDKFLLGAFPWKIMRIDRDSVTVAPANSEGATPPFWRNSRFGRRLQTGVAFGKLMRRLADACAENASRKEAIKPILRDFGLDGDMAAKTADFVCRQIEATGALPDDRTIIAEYFHDSDCGNQLMLHSVFGKQINAPLALLLRDRAARVSDADIGFFCDDDGILLMAGEKNAIPANLLQSINIDEIRPVLEAILPSAPLFHMTFRYNAGRALMMGVRKAAQRQPLWVQRLRGAEMLDSVIGDGGHPLIRETKRECMEDYWDIPGLEAVLGDIKSNAIRVREVLCDTPSPMSLPLRRQAEAVLLYDYNPTTAKITGASRDALKELRQIKPAAEQLAIASERRKLPEDEKHLHSLLMAEGDLTAGELPLPIEWFEALSAEGRALYIEPGLWIAAEHEEQYRTALENGDDATARLDIVRRVLRYRGPQEPSQIAERYFWEEKTALGILNGLCEKGSAVKDDRLYYHADLYERARHGTVAARRRQIKTAPAENYAALAANRLWIPAPPGEQMEKALKALAGKAFLPELWENALLPVRVNGYNPNLLDAALSSGDVFWNISGENASKEAGQFRLGFYSYGDIDWDADIAEAAEALEGGEKAAYEALLRRGASFISGLGIAESGKAFDALLSLAEKGLVHADSFAPVRQWIEREKTKNCTAKRRINARVSAFSAGRWEITRPLKRLTVEEYLDRAFDKNVVLCRETAGDMGISWGAALETLRIWEYTGKARRGYFVYGMSGAQFIRDREFAGTVAALESPPDGITWLAASDPAQSWGRILPHLENRSFICVPGTAAALKKGVPTALFEKHGRELRVFDFESLPEALNIFAENFKKRRIFPFLKKLSVKKYPKEAAKALKGAGFIPVMMDFELYRG